MGAPEHAKLPPSLSTTDRAIIRGVEVTVGMESVHRPADTAGVRRRRVLFEEALSLIEVSYHDDRLTVDDLSERIFSSRRQLQRAFAEAGTSVQECLHIVRMRRAAELLRGSSLPVAEVAHSVGYRQPPQFAKAFRRQYKLTPSQWRNLRPLADPVAEPDPSPPLAVPA